MPDYKLYKLNHDGRVEQAIDLRCSQREAKQRALELATDGPVEVWEGARPIAHYEARGTARARALMRGSDWLTIAWGAWGAFLAAVLVYLIFTSTL
jgi:hypothetical protein